jgi:magnesium-transporting ATPase (P-type)
LKEVPADAILIEGEIIVDESMLTGTYIVPYLGINEPEIGETVPVAKIAASLSDLQSTLPRFNSSKSNIFAGTKILSFHHSSGRLSQAVAYNTGMNYACSL